MSKVDRLLQKTMRESRRRRRKSGGKAAYIANALRTARSIYNPINSRTYFTGGLP